VYYGYRAWGPNWPYVSTWTKGSATGFVSDVDASGNRFNPNKLLLDPYAREMSQDPNTPSCLDGTIYASPARRIATRTAAVARPRASCWRRTPRRLAPSQRARFKDDVVYEVHVRGLTMNDTSMSRLALRGTYAGAAPRRPIWPAWASPRSSSCPCRKPRTTPMMSIRTSTTGDNYWGYMTLNYFAPDRRYASDKTPGGPDARMEGDGQGLPRCGHQGVDRRGLQPHRRRRCLGRQRRTHRLQPAIVSRAGQSDLLLVDRGPDQYSWDNTGVGGNYNTRNTTAQNLIVDSLAYWRDALGVDGFRFDLASVLGNTCQHGCFNFDKMDAGQCAESHRATSLPPRPAAGGSGIDLIAEPWAIGGNSYQVGGFPSGWAEWNGIYRDACARSRTSSAWKS
jgi:isoamylase